MGGSGIRSAVGATVGLCSRWEADIMVQRLSGAMSLADCTVGRKNYMRTGYRRRRFSTSLKVIWLTGDIHWTLN